MKILFCPAHLMLDDASTSSELYHAYQVVNRLASKNPGSVAVTGRVEFTSPKPYRTIEVYKKSSITPSFFDAIRFTLCYTIEELKLIKREKFDLLYHVRPFAIGKSFNLVPILGLQGRMPFIIGPITLPYEAEDKVAKRSAVYWLTIDLIKRIISPILVFLSRQTIRSASAIMVEDAQTADEIAKYISREKIYIITPGKDKAEFTFREPSTPSNILLAAGGLLPRKGLDVSLRAFAEVVRRHPSLEFHIYGQGPEKENLERLCDELGIRERVHFFGLVPNHLLRERYREAKLFVHAARAERFGHVYVEALASGLPVVATDNHGAQEVLASAGAGLISPQEDHVALAKNIERFLSDDTLYRTTAERGRAFFEQQYDWEKSIMPKHEAVFAAVT